MSLRIGLTHGEDMRKYDNYVAWLSSSSDSEVESVDLSLSQNLAADVATLDGVVLTGGCDIHPDRYGMGDSADVCDAIDTLRDELEIQLLDLVEEHQIPLLGICRGLQLINVFRGGTLIPDLPLVVPMSQRHQKNNGVDRRHSVQVVPGTLLYKAVRELSGEVNSAHHQAVDHVAEGLVVSARGEDGVVEAIEHLDSVGKPWMLAVQWHPERMPDIDNPFARGLLDAFLFEAESTKVLFNRKIYSSRP